VLPDQLPLLTVKEVAAALRVSTPTVYRWVSDGEMEAIRYGKPLVAGSTKRGGAIRIPRAEVDARLASTAAAVEPEAA